LCISSTTLSPGTAAGRQEGVQDAAERVEVGALGGRLADRLFGRE